MRNPKQCKKKGNKSRRKDNRDLFLLSLPGILKVFIFSYIPFIWLTIAFQFYKPRRGILGSDWVGFENFNFLLKSSTASTLIRNAVVINVLGIIFGTIFSVILGLFLYEITRKIMLKVAQTVVIFPYFVSWPLVGVLVMSFLSDRTGMLTNIIKSLFGSEIDPYSNPNIWWGIITFCSVWKSAGLSAVTYYAVLMTNDKSLYEAAEIDGASRFRTLWHVALPSLKLMIILNVIMSSANVLRCDFNMVYYVTNNAAALYDKTDVIETYIFRALRTDGDYSISTAIGLLQAFVGFVLTIIVNQVCKKISKESLF